MNHIELPHVSRQPAINGDQTLNHIAACGRGHRWLVVLCTMLMLVWTGQHAAGWFKPPSDIGLTQHSELEPAHTVRFDWHESTRVSRSESKSDPVAVPATTVTDDDSASGLRLLPGSATARLKHQAARLPAIRAPPAVSSSA